MPSEDPDVELTIEAGDHDTRLVMAVECDGDVVPVATADAGRLALFREDA